MNNFDVDNILSQYGYKRLEDYCNNTTPFKCEKDGYWFNVRLNNLQKNEVPSKFGVSNPFLSHNFINALKKRNSNAIYISHKIVTKKHRKRILVTLKCNCGNVFIKDGSQIESGKINLMCPECYKVHKSKTHRNNKLKMINGFKDKGYKIIEEPMICDSKALWLIEDTKGYRGRLSYNKLKNGRRISIYAPNNYDLRLYNLNMFFKNIGSKSKAIKIIDKEYVEILCECGNKFKCLYYKPFETLRNKCPKCNKRVSKFEDIISIFLNNQNIKFKKEFKINSCRDILPLPFDFWLEDYNILIEVDGQQHFQSIDFWGGEEYFSLVKKHDKIKNDYCKKWNIPLLRISYLDIENNTYQDKILKFMQSVKE